MWLTCSPNGADFPSGTVEGTRTAERGGLYFRYSTNPQSTTHMLLAFVVLLAGFLLLRILTWCPLPPPPTTTHPPMTVTFPSHPTLTPPDPHPTPTRIHDIIAPVLARRREAQAQAQAEATLKGKRAEAFFTRSGPPPPYNSEWPQTLNLTSSSLSLSHAHALSSHI